MGSSNFGDLFMGSGRSLSSGTGKKSRNEKPKQPQRGLGVAQLEKIRLHNQMMAAHLPYYESQFQSSTNKEDMKQMPFPSNATSSSAYGIHPNNTMAFGDTTRTDRRFDGYNSSSTLHLVQPTMTLPLLPQSTEDSRWLSIDSSQNSDPRDLQELDLELRLAL
ncbi:protein SPEAR1-like isoform X1 [Typha angustifolia]|uniref:protein SPEAR1-like isoform X1 n=1 Tax=Typha angustifolia TaxID=59011 RepID=UPI003C2E527D